MKLPTRGLLLNPDGQIAWAWEHNDPTTDFESLPPFVTTMEGDTHSVASPDAIVLDLEEAGLKPGDLSLLMHDLSAARFRRQADGRILITQMLPTGEEIEHPVMRIIASRKKGGFS